MDETGKICTQVECDEALYEIDISGKVCNKKKRNSYYQKILGSITSCLGEFVNSASLMMEYRKFESMPLNYANKACNYPSFSLITVPT